MVTDDTPNVATRGTPRLRFNRTTKRDFCPHHSEVVVVRHKTRKSQSMPCWRCLQDGQTSAERKSRDLHVSLATQAEHLSALEARLLHEEEESDIIQKQLARLTEQCTTLSTELAEALKQVSELHAQKMELEKERDHLAAALSATGAAAAERLHFARSTGSFPRTSTAEVIPAPTTPAPAPSTLPPAADGGEKPASQRPALYPAACVLPVPQGPQTMESHALGASNGEEEDKEAYGPSSVGSAGEAVGISADVNTKPSTKRGVVPSVPPSSLPPKANAGRSTKLAPFIERAEEAVSGTPREVQGSPAPHDARLLSAEKKSNKQKWGWKKMFKRKKEQGSSTTPLQSSKAGARPEEPSGPLDVGSQPQAVDVLIERLIGLLRMRGPQPLLHIYKSVQELEEWRMNVLCDLAIAQHDASQSCRHSSVSGSIESVGTLLARFKKAVMSNIAESFVLASEQSNVIHETLEVVRQHEAFQARKLAVAREKVAEDNGNLDAVLQLCAVDHWTQDVSLTLRDAAEKRAVECVRLAHLKVADAMHGDTTSPGQITMGVLRILVDEVDWAANHVSPLFDPSYHVKNIIIKAYDEQVLHTLTVLMEQGTDNVDYADLLEVKAFVKSYQGLLSRLTDAPPREELSAMQERLLQDCLVKTRQLAAEWLGRIKQRKADMVPVPDGEGRPCTPVPEDIFQIVNSYVTVALGGGIEGEELCDFIAVIFNALKQYIEEDILSLKYVKSKLDTAADLSPYVAVVNDYERLQDKLQELRQSLAASGKMTEDALELGTIDSLLDQLRDSIAEVSYEASQVIVFIVLRVSCMNMFRESHEGSYGDAWALMPSTKEGASRAPDPVQEALLTLEDFLGDVKDWLPGYIFWGVARSAYESFVSLYVVHVVRGKSEWKDVAVAAQKIRRDRQGISDTFSRYRMDLEQAGLDELARPLLILDDLEQIVLKGGHAGTGRTGRFLRALPVEWGVDAVLRINMLRGERLDIKAKQDVRGKLLQWHQDRLAAEQRNNKNENQLKEAPRPNECWKLNISPLDAKIDVSTLLMHCLTSRE